MKAFSFPLRLALVVCLLHPGIAAVALLGDAGPSFAQATSSGGYSRPGSGGVGRPGVGGGAYSRPQTPGTSGFSGGDRSISRGYSGQALREYQRRPTPAAPSGAPWDRRPPTYGGSPYSPPRRPPLESPYAVGPGYQTRFGAWDLVFLLSLLNTLNAPGHTQFFRDNRDNPDYRAWRREADRMAQDDPALAAKLAELDQRLAAPVQAGRSPSADASAPGGGSGVVILVILIGGGVFVALWLMRRRARTQEAASAGPPLSGSAQSRFRVGMTFPLDPAPFLLAAGATKVKPPPGEGMISVEAVGVVMDEAVALHRLYLPGRNAFLQLHLAASGEPDECRYFNRIDEVTPSSPDEWGFWVDPAQGMIGWPQFQTKDGKLYDRVWAPGGGRVAPREQVETIADVAGVRRRKLLPMLYGVRTGAAPPAPDSEYILVCAVDDAGQAWVEIHAGIDINPATLSLPSVPLSA